MSFSWNTIGMESPPIRGRLDQFKTVAMTFDTIADRTGHLADELWSMRTGQSERFTGHAADAFRMKIGSFLEPLSDVPLVSSNISLTFEDHYFKLEVLMEKANEALARAHTGWNRRESAKDEVEGHEASVRWLDSQISELRCYCSGHCYCSVDAQKTHLESQRNEVIGDLSRAHKDVRVADAQLAESRRDWKRLRTQEDTLNQDTAREVVNLELWSLRDTGNFFSEGKERLEEWIRESWKYLVDELLQVLHRALSTFLDWLDIAGLLLEWIPAVNVVFKAIEMLAVGAKLVAGLGLVLSGQMKFSEWLTDTMIDAAGFILPGGRLISKGVKRIIKNGTVHKVVDYLPKMADSLEAGAKKTLKGATRSVYGLPMVRQFNDLLYKGHDWFYRRIPFKSLGVRSRVVRESEGFGFLKNVISPNRKDPVTWASDRIFEVAKDSMIWGAKKTIDWVRQPVLVPFPTIPAMPPFISPTPWQFDTPPWRRSSDTDPIILA